MLTAKIAHFQLIVKEQNILIQQYYAARNWTAMRKAQACKKNLLILIEGLEIDLKAAQDKWFDETIAILAEID